MRPLTIAGDGPPIPMLPVLAVLAAGDAGEDACEEASPSDTVPIGLDEADDPCRNLPGARIGECPAMVVLSIACWICIGSGVGESVCCVLMDEVNCSCLSAMLTKCDGSRSLSAMATRNASANTFPFKMHPFIPAAAYRFRSEGATVAVNA